MTDEAATRAAQDAGWNTTVEGPAPFAHGHYVAPLAESLDLDELIAPDGTIRPTP